MPNPTEAEKNILLFVPNYEGLGDLFFGVKVSELLKKKYPNAKINIITDQKSIEKLNKIATAELKNLNLLDADEVFLNLQNNNKEWLSKNNLKITSDGKLTADLIIEGPVFQFLQIKKDFIDSNTNLLLMPEYNEGTFNPDVVQFGFKQEKIKIIETGFGSGFALPQERKGILIDKELKAFAESDPDKKQLMRIQALSQLSNKLGNRLRGENSATAYLANTEIGFAYHPDRMPYYAATALTIAANQKDTKKNIDFLVGGNINNIKRELQDPSFLENLRQNGFTDVEFISLADANSSEKWAKPDASSGQKKVFRILYQNSFNHADLKNIFKLSNIVGVTGNQSLSEAISSGAIPVYSVLNFSRDLFNRLVTYIQKNGGHKAALVFRDLANTSDSNADMIQMYGGMLADSDVKNQFIKAFNKIRNECDLEKAILATVEPVLSEKKGVFHGRKRSGAFTSFFRTLAINETDRNYALTFMRNNNKKSLGIKEINELDSSYQFFKEITFTDNKYILKVESVYWDQKPKEIVIPPQKLIEFANKQKEAVLTAKSDSGLKQKR